MSTIRFRRSINRWARVPGLHRCARSRKAAGEVHPARLRAGSTALLSTITVTNDGDNGPGSLRDALAAAGSGGTIEFARSAYGTITLSSGPLVVASSVTIEGPGQATSRLAGTTHFRTSRSWPTSLPGYQA